MSAIKRVTADTVTDEQIRALRKKLRALRRKLNEFDGELARAELDADIGTCTIALTDRRAMAYMMQGVAEGVRKARARCAEIINARRASEVVK